MRKCLMAVAVMTVLAGCATREKGADIGGGTDDYKESPCACAEIPQSFKNQYAG